MNSYLNDLNDVQQKLPSKSGLRLPHYCLTRLNLYDLGDGIDFRDFPLKCGYPQPIYMETEEYASHFNHPYVLVRQKQSYKERLTQLKTKIMKNRKKPIEAKLGIAEYDRNFLFFVELLKHDPDKYFDGPYDWYYTGGNLTLSTHNDSEIVLLSATGKYLDKLRLSQHPKRQSNIIDLGKNSSIIYETYRFNDYSMVRQKNHITAFRYNDANALVDLKETFVLNSKVPFLSSTFVTDSKIATLDADQIIKFWDVGTSSIAQSKKVEIKRKIDNWGYLTNFNESILLYANHSEVNILDYRVPDYQTIGTYGYENSYECNQIYGIANSKFENLVYISANHAIYGLDIRRLPENLLMDTVSKWTHLMKFPPIMIDTVLYNGDEYIYLSSSLKDNQKICVNIKNTVYSSPYLPYKPKNIADTYNQIRLRGICIDPISDFRERINLCTTGIGIFVKNDILHTVLSNASGDIFYQKFDESDTVLSIDIIKNMEQWVEYLRTNRCSKITNMSQLNSVLLAMQCKKLSLSTGMVEDIDLPAEECRRRKPKWQRTVNELYEYKDVLAKNMLDVWNIKISAEDKYIGPQLNSELSTSKLPYVSKIDEWFTRNSQIVQNDWADENITTSIVDNPSQIIPCTSTQNEEFDSNRIFTTKKNTITRRRGRSDGF